MAQFLNFFPRQFVMGNNGASGTLYSNVFDAVNVQTILYTLEVSASSFTGTGTLVRATMESTDDPGMAGFVAYSGAITITGSAGTGVLRTGEITSPPSRFLRLKLEHAQGSYSMVRFDARGFC
jgi:hypothetical protein